jgi:hypothetical protein
MFHIEHLLNCIVHDILTLPSTKVHASSDQLQARINVAPVPLRLRPKFMRYLWLGRGLYSKIVFTDVSLGRTIILNICESTQFGTVVTF